MVCIHTTITFPYKNTTTDKKNRADADRRMDLSYYYMQKYKEHFCRKHNMKHVLIFPDRAVRETASRQKREFCCSKATPALLLVAAACCECITWRDRRCGNLLAQTPAALDARPSCSSLARHLCGGCSCGPLFWHVLLLFPPQLCLGLSLALQLETRKPTPVGRVPSSRGSATAPR